MKQMLSMEYILTSDQKRPPLPVNDTKLPANEQMSAKNQRRKKGLPVIHQRSICQLQILGKMLSSIIGQLQVKCEFIKWLLKINKNELNIEK